MAESKRSGGGLPGAGEESTAAAVAAALAAVQALKEGARYQDGSLPRLPPMGDMLFDLAQMQMKSVKDMADLGQKQAQMMLEHVKQQRSGLSGRSPFPRALVSVALPRSDGDEENWQFLLRNRSGEERTFTLPDFAELRRIGTRDCEDSVFTKIKFCRVPKPETGTRITEIKVAKGAEETLQLDIGLDERFESSKARYRASVILEADTGMPLELIVELLVKGSSASSPAAPPSSTG